MPTLDAFLSLLAGLLLIAPLTPTQAASQVLVWDSESSLTNAIAVEKRTGWKAVAGELFNQEREPVKAASDPGYYGREHSFKGDAVVENSDLIAVFMASCGRVAIFAKSPPLSPGGAPQSHALRELANIAPHHASQQTPGIRRVNILRNASDEAVLEVFFSGSEGTNASALFSFDRSRTVEIKPAGTMNGLTLHATVDYGVVPGFIGDDLIFGPAEFPSANTMHVPAEHCLVGLLHGGDAELVLTWPRKDATVAFGLGTTSSGDRGIDSIQFQGGSLCVTALSAPGLWHREVLGSTHLEKDVKLRWKPPFSGRWKTQLREADVRTTFAFRDTKSEIWRGVPGSYVYPAWISNGEAFLHLSKKVPPKGAALIYCLEPSNTPASVTTPVDAIKATLGRELSGAVLDLAGRKLRTHHRRGGDGVHRACTCGCTEAIQAFFEGKEEVTKKEQIRSALDDMMFFVQCHVDRIAEYRRFASEMIQFLEARSAAEPAHKSYLDALKTIVARIPEEYDVQKDNMKSAAFGEGLLAQTMSLTQENKPNNLKAYMELLKAWRDMGGAQDYVVAVCHMTARRLAQEAGYGCAGTPAALSAAAEIRARCRQVLRNPDGYEIWSDY